MKKIAALLSVLLLSCSLSFARGIYNGDIQFPLGFGAERVVINENTTSPVKAAVFGAGIETWHLFKPLPFMGVGFKAGLDAEIGLSEYMEQKGGLAGDVFLNFGPAVGFYLGKVVRLAASFGFSTGLNIETLSYSKDASSYDMVMGFLQGFDVEIQAKFVPDFFINPVIGWRLTRGYADSYYSATNKSTTGTKVSQGYGFTQNVFYIALSFSW